MSIKLIDSNIIINDGTSNFILDRVRSSGKQNDTIELNAPTVSNANINDLSMSSDEKNIVFTYACIYEQTYTCDIYIYVCACLYVLFLSLILEMGGGKYLLTTNAEHDTYSVVSKECLCRAC